MVQQSAHPGFVLQSNDGLLVGSFAFEDLESDLLAEAVAAVFQGQPHFGEGAGTQLADEAVAADALIGGKQGLVAFRDDDALGVRFVGPWLRRKGLRVAFDLLNARELLPLVAALLGLVLGIHLFYSRHGSQSRDSRSSRLLLCPNDTVTPILTALIVATTAEEEANPSCPLRLLS